MRKCTKIWTCKGGRKVRICDMSDEHLRNTIALLERTAPLAREQVIASAYSAAASLQGEMASYYADQDLDALEQSAIEDFTHPLYEDLVNEQSRRKIISLKNGS